jgi:hypothetical protein
MRSMKSIKREEEDERIWGWRKGGDKISYGQSKLQGKELKNGRK